MAAQNFFNANQTLFDQLKRTVLAKIASGEWAPGLQLPSELELSREFRVSAGTLRRVMDFLENNKYVLRQQGRGTFVLEPSSREIMQRFERFRADDEGSLSTTIEVLSTEEGEATEIEADNLKLRGGQMVRRMTRLTRSRGRPFLYEEVAIPSGMFPTSKDIDNPELWISLTARNCGVLLGDAEEKLSVVSCPSAVARHLGIRNGLRIMRIRGVMRTVDGKPARWRDAYCEGEHIHYSVPLTRRL